MGKGILYMIPTYLDEANDHSYIAPVVKEVISHTSHYLVENVRTARRYISSLKLGLDISTLQFEQLDKNVGSEQITQLCQPLKQGSDVGIISEAGLPGIADPGMLAVRYAHRYGYRVVPLPGPSSIIQALIASGFNGQTFAFHGYLPIDPKKRKDAIRNMHSTLSKTGQTQLFMETPYRNDKLFADLIHTLPGNTMLAVASGISGNQELIKTMTVGEWKQKVPQLHKIPTIFSIGA